MNKNEVTPVQIAIRIVIIIVVIILLLLVSFAMVRFVPKVLNSLSGVRGIFGGRETLVVSLDKETVAQGETAEITYRQEGGRDEGHYELSYACAKIAFDTHLEVAGGDQRELLLCDEPFTLGQATTTEADMKVAVKTFGESVSYDQPVTITIKHVDEDADILESESVTLNVRGVNNSIAVTPSENTDDEEPVPTPSQPTTSKPTSPTYSSVPADLSVTYGELKVNSLGQTTLVFNVTNSGGQSTGSWRFHAVLPRSGGQTVYDSPYQSSIPPQGTSVMTLVFDSAIRGNIVIDLDYFNEIREASEGNNRLVAEVK